METDESCQRKWENIPDNILLKIFLLIQEPDIVHASSVCRNWRRMFYEPKFWRSVTFDLNSDFHSAIDLPKMILNHLLAIGTFVEHLTIVCPEKTFLAQGHFAECVKVILDTLSKRNVFIQTFQLNKVRMAVNWKGFDLLKRDLIHVLCQFIKSQTCLQTLVISEALLTTTFGHMVMSSLARSPSVDTLQQLDISYIYVSYRGWNSQHGEFVRSILQKCKKLGDIKLNCVALKGINVLKLCASMKCRLKRVHLKPSMMTEEGEALGLYNPGGGIHEHIWRKVTQLCPELRVIAELHVIGDEPFLDQIHFAPICNLTLKGIGAPPGDRVTLGRILRKLSKCSLENLESVTLVGHMDVFFFCGKRSKFLKYLVLKFVENHPKIKSLKISAKLMNKTLLESITSKLFVQYHGNRNVLSII